MRQIEVQLRGATIPQTINLEKGIIAEVGRVTAESYILVLRKKVAATPERIPQLSDNGIQFLTKLTKLDLKVEQVAFSMIVDDRYGECVCYPVTAFNYLDQSDCAELLMYLWRAMNGGKECPAHIVCVSGRESRHPDRSTQDRYHRFVQLPSGVLLETYERSFPGAEASRRALTEAEGGALVLKKSFREFGAFTVALLDGKPVAAWKKATVVQQPGPVKTAM